MFPSKKVLPAVTCSVQATYLTGKLPDEHGIVANGWYFRDECEVKFWRQSNKLVQAPKVWEIAKSIDSKLYLCQPFLVVQHVLYSRLCDYAAPDVSRRWEKIT